MPELRNDARLNFRLNDELLRTIEDAAAQTGQTVSDFAISTLVQASRQILREQQVTRLSARDRQLFAEMLDDESTRSNAALVKAARCYTRNRLADAGVDEPSGSADPTTGLRLIVAS